MAVSISLNHRFHDVADTTAALDLPVQLHLPGEPTEISARLCRVDRGFLKLTSNVALAGDARVEVTVDGCAIRSEVISCERGSPGTFHVAVRRVYGPQGAIRAEPRIPVDLSAVLKSPGCEPMFARIVDMSQSGLGFELPAPVGPGTRVSVHFVCGIAFGEIRHCSAQDAIYRAGMRIEEFVVRHGSEALAKEAISPLLRERASSVPSRRLFRLPVELGRRLACSMAGHEYGWFTDLWERAVLRCRRCQKVLSP
jgi:PilZ domain